MRHGNGRIHLPGSQHQQQGIQVVGLPNTQLLVLTAAAVRQAYPDKTHGEVVHEAIELIAMSVYWDARGALAGAVHAAKTKAEQDAVAEDQQERSGQALS